MNKHEKSPDTANDTDIATHKIHVTFFKNEYASTLTTKELTLPELQNIILAASGPTKEALPWLKGAQFGKIKTDQIGRAHV